jgi:hypothetical protein
MEGDEAKLLNDAFFNSIDPTETSNLIAFQVGKGAIAESW